MVLAAPWVTRAVVSADRRLRHGLLGPGRLAQRVRALEADTGAGGGGFGRAAAPARTRPARRRPGPAGFCAAELLANAAKHSHANTIRRQAVGREGALMLSVADDGVGGADPARGSGLSGLAQRVSTVDGSLDITSPPGGPTVVTAVLPLHA
jgi:hypothetical protein